MDSTDFGESIRHTSAYVAATEYLGGSMVPTNDTDEMDFKIKGGNDRLVRALANAIGRKNIRTGYDVSKIKQNGTGVEVYGKGKRKITADKCVCALPAHCLRRIQWDPPLLARQLDAANQLQYARITKTAVLCSQRFWPSPGKSGFSVFTNLASDFCFDSTYGQSGEQGILCSYAIGDKADDIASASEKDLGLWIIKDVSKAVSKKPVAPLGIRRQAWQSDRFTGGAYAFYRPG